MQAIILAGGKGSRLKPFTKIIPKPLVPIGDMPILEVVLRQLKTAGFNDVIITVNHLAELIMAFFGDGKKLGLNISYSMEEKPLGTAGPLSLITEYEDDFLVMNGDLLTTLDYRKMIEWHKKEKNDLTIACYNKKVKIVAVITNVPNSPIIEAAKKGYSSVMTPSPFVYLDYNQGESTIDPPIYAGLRVSKCYSFEPVPDSVDAKYVLGGQGNLWTEQVPTFRYAEYMTYPRAWALSEVFWSPKETKNWTDFSQRMETHFNRADVAGVNYSRAVYDAIVTTQLQGEKLILELGSELPGIDIFYSFDDTMPGSYSTKYTSPVEVPEGPITLRVITYRNGKPLGHLITLNREKLMQRAY